MKCGEHSTNGHIIHRRRRRRAIKFYKTTDMLSQLKTTKTLLLSVKVYTLRKIMLECLFCMHISVGVTFEGVFMTSSHLFV